MHAYGHSWRGGVVASGAAGWELGNSARAVVLGALWVPAWCPAW